MTKLRSLWLGELPLDEAFWTWAITIGLLVNLTTSALFLALIAADRPWAALVAGYGPIGALQRPGRGRRLALGRAPPRPRRPRRSGPRRLRGRDAPADGDLRPDGVPPRLPSPPSSTRLGRRHGPQVRSTATVRRLRAGLGAARRARRRRCTPGRRCTGSARAPAKARPGPARRDSRRSPRAPASRRVRPVTRPPRRKRGGARAEASPPRARRGPRPVPGHDVHGHRRGQDARPRGDVGRDARHVRGCIHAGEHRRRRHDRPGGARRRRRGRDHRRGGPTPTRGVNGGVPPARRAGRLSAPRTTPPGAPARGAGGAGGR